MIDGVRAVLYTKSGIALKVMLVSPLVTLITEGDKTYVLRSEVAGVMRFHESDANVSIHAPIGSLSPEDVRFLRSIRVSQWGVNE